MIVFYSFEQALEAYDVKILDQQGRLRIDQPQVRQGLIKTLDWFTSFYTQGYTPPNAINSVSYTHLTLPTIYSV